MSCLRLRNSQLADGGSQVGIDPVISMTLAIRNLAGTIGKCPLSILALCWARGAIDGFPIRNLCQLRPEERQLVLIWYDFATGFARAEPLLRAGGFWRGEKEKQIGRYGFGARGGSGAVFDLRISPLLEEVLRHFLMAFSQRQM
eukprot:TRINITY_DN5403_c0_g1_i2.p3 TRINITY_DN5403_c0_g1~~TRINITY_DN5403_c0_g1_i2.p3  ORF type:complete len:144 (-),score=9.96 TRINITY_DN5403_c0_g1_i2:1391-1822(-)